MSLRLETLQVARVAPKILGDAAELVRSFIQSHYLGPQGFCDRTGKPDLYYTVFGRDCLAALQAPAPDLSAIAEMQPLEVEKLDFVHLCAFARCCPGLWDTQGCTFPEMGDVVALRLEKFRTPDGGFNPQRGARFGTAYGAFLGLGAYQDIGLPDEWVLPFAQATLTA